MLFPWISEDYFLYNVTNALVYFLLLEPEQKCLKLYT